MSIKEKYSQEISDIQTKLDQLEAGRFAENTNADTDGLLATNVNQLRKMIFKLLAKIEKNSDSETDVLLKAFEAEK